MLESDGIKIIKYASETILPDLLKNMSILGANGVKRPIRFNYIRKRGTTHLFWKQQSSHVSL